MTESRDYPDLLARFRSKRILVIGDLMLDEFIWGRVSRISPEAPVPVVEVSEHSYVPGGAANVALNLREFTEKVTVMGITGNDIHAEILKGLLSARDIRLDGLLQADNYQTTVKTRIIARQQQVVRVDRESTVAPELQYHDQALAIFEKMLGEVDAVILEDYAKGFLTQSFVDRVSALASRHGKIVTVDPNPRNALAWRGVTAIKPNLIEAYHVAGFPRAEVTAPVSEDAVLRQAGERLLEKWDTEMLLITLGGEGMMLFRRDQPPYAVAPCRQEVSDSVGAGDTAIALFTLALAAGSTPEQAAEIANHAGSIVVSKLGTATLTPEELLTSLQQTK